MGSWASDRCIVLHWLLNCAVRPYCPHRVYYLMGKRIYKKICSGDGEFVKQLLQKGSAG